MALTPTWGGYTVSIKLGKYASSRQGVGFCANSRLTVLLNNYGPGTDPAIVELARIEQPLNPGADTPQAEAPQHMNVAASAP